MTSIAGSQFNKFLLEGKVEGLGFELFTKNDVGCAHRPFMTVVTWKTEGSTLQGHHSANVKLWLELQPTFLMQLYGTLTTLDLFCFARGEPADDSVPVQQLKHCVQALEAAR